MRRRPSLEQREAEAERTPSRGAPAVGSAAGVLLALQRRVGNAAVAQRLLEVEAGDEDASETGQHAGRCGGAVVADTFVGQGGADPLSAGGVATRQLTWADFPTTAGIPGRDAQTGYGFSVSGGTFTAAFSRARSWAKASAKTGPGQAALLRHEQYHLDLAVLMAQKATAAGDTSQAGMDTLVATTAARSDLYDDETGGSTNATEQAAWEARIDAGTVPYP